jgi:C4-dicarboxylate-specific signal transduction histidine kinase
VSDADPVLPSREARAGRARALAIALAAALVLAAACDDAGHLGIRIGVGLGALAIVVAAVAAHLGTMRGRHGEEAALWRDAARIAELTRSGAVAELEERVARELGTPIAALLNNLGAARRLLAAGDRGSLPEVVSAVDEGLADAQRAALAIRGMRQQLGTVAIRLEPLDLNAVAREAIGLVRRYAAAHRVALSSALDERLPAVSGDATQLLQVAVSLVLQAVDSAATSRRRAVLVATALGADGVELSFSDSGARISEVDRAHLFTPPSAASGGLGLDICAARAIVEAHGGRISAGRPDSGALFRVSLPPAATGAPLAVAPPPERYRGG